MSETKQEINFNFWPKWSENKLFTLLLSIFFVYLLVWFVGQIRNEFKRYDYIGRGEFRDILNVEGQGKAIGKPDVAILNLGVLSEAKEVLVAQNENTQKVNQLIEKIKGLGIESKDIQTVNYSITPQYDWIEGKQVFRNYLVTQNLNVKVRNLNLLGQILQVAGSSGANQVSGINFTLDNPEELKAQAREKALANAYEKANFFAQKAGLKLGKVVYINESSYLPSPTPLRSFSTLEGMGGGEVPTPNIESGSTEVQVNLSVGFEIKN